jgi:two-component system cell cycle sensor histidine kinase/response regulator CckA
MTCRFLESRGFKVLGVSRYCEVMQLVIMTDLPIDLFVTDVNMPGIDGGQLAHAFAASRPGTPILFLSAYSQEASAIPHLVHTPTAYLQKPFLLLTLLATVGNLLQKNTVH